MFTLSRALKCLRWTNTIPFCYHRILTELQLLHQLPLDILSNIKQCNYQNIYFFLLNYTLSKLLSIIDPYLLSGIEEWIPAYSCLNTFNLFLPTNKIEIINDHKHEIFSKVMNKWNSKLRPFPKNGIYLNKSPKLLKVQYCAVNMFN